MPNPNPATTIELNVRTARCVVGGCHGSVVRHSLGAGQSVDRCTRCFRRYQVREPVNSATIAEKSRLRRMFDEFVAWRDD